MLWTGSLVQSSLEPQPSSISCCLPHIPSYKLLTLQDVAHTCEGQMGWVQVFKARPQSLQHTTQEFIGLHPLLHEYHPRQSQNMGKTLCILPPDILVFLQACSLKVYCLISELLRYLAYIPTLLDSHLVLMIFTLFLITSGKGENSARKWLVLQKITSSMHRLWKACTRGREREIPQSPEHSANYMNDF